ncbi:MAG: ABC-F family ATP-binding cassette domain-containing protein [Phycisphaeraceae bacterium]|nr:ABC-F family ATP-binding cassette domain-containing protein [Phycisphaeraceae bacterium]
MPLAGVTGIRLAHGTHVVLDGVHFAIEPGERVGLVGRNGQGKSTLLRIMAGDLEPDRGSVHLERGRRLGYLRQHPQIDPEQSVLEAAEGAFAALESIERDLEALYDEMATAEGDALDALLRRQADLEHRRDAAGGFAVAHRVEAALHGVGFTDEQFPQRVGTLSGGQRGRLALARLLLESPDLLLLDEPTNHLDIEGRRWLETFLADEFMGAVVLVSHDRWLLDRVVHRIEEVEGGALHDYPGNYEQYRALRAERQLAQARAHRKQLDHIRREEAFIRRYKAGQRAKQARGRQTRLERFRSDEMVDRPSELDVFEVRLPPAPRVGDRVLAATALRKAYGDRVLFRDLDLVITPGERLGIVGPNGAGKTTLVRCLLGEEAIDAGDLRTSPQLRVGWFRQTQEHLDLTLSVWEYLQSVIVAEDGGARASEQQARDLAGAFLFSGADQEKILRTLSGGERSRAVIAGLVASSKNLLVLDEPTNHLDIPATERLEAALATDPADGGFSGTILLVSHDRALLANVCDRLLVLDGRGGWTLVSSDVPEWLDQADHAAATPSASPSATPPRRASASSSPRAASKDGAAAPPRATPAHTKEQAKVQTKAQSNASTKAPNAKPSSDPPRDRTSQRLARLSQSVLEARIEEIESRLREIEAEMGDPDFWKNAARHQKISAEREQLVDELKPLEAEWNRRAANPG